MRPKITGGYETLAFSLQAAMGQFSLTWTPTTDIIFAMRGIGSEIELT